MIRNLRALLKALSVVGKTIAGAVSYLLLLIVYAVFFPLFSLTARSQLRGPRSRADTAWVERKNELRTLKEARWL